MLFRKIERDNNNYRYSKKFIFLTVNYQNDYISSKFSQFFLSCLQISLNSSDI